MIRRAPIILPMLALLAACSGGNAPREEGGAGEAEGEVLGGSISDDMLPLDSLQSQSPPLKAAPDVADTADGEEEGAGAETEGAEAPAVAPEAAVPTG